MPETVFYDPNTPLLRVRAWGEDPIENWYASREKVIELAEAHKTMRLLVDVRELETAPSVLDIFDFGQDWPIGIKTAILVGEKTDEDVMFVETVAVNRSKQMQIFYEESEAVRWLGK